MFFWPFRLSSHGRLAVSSPALPTVRIKDLATKARSCFVLVSSFCTVGFGGLLMMSKISSAFTK